MGSKPVASGSSVPAWPAFCAPNSHLILATASVEPVLYGLSSTTHPEIGLPFFLPLRAIKDLFHSSGIWPPATASVSRNCSGSNKHIERHAVSRSTGRSNPFYQRGQAG